eukprot:489881_1
MNAIINNLLVRVKSFYQCGLRDFCAIKIKSCTKCATKLPLSEFYRDCQSRDGYCYQYKICMLEQSANSSYKFFQKICSNAKIHAKTRNIGPFEMNAHFLFQLYKQQQGKCYYSDIPLDLNRFSGWQCSLERLDPRIGYNKENVALIALEFNHRKQWSIEKIEQIPSVLDETSGIHVTDNMILDALHHTSKRPRRYATWFEMRDNTKYYYCHLCQAYKTEEQFYPRTTTQCKSCIIRKTLLKNNTLIGSIQVLLATAKSHAKKRNNNEFTTRNEFNLTRADIINKIQTQSARCYYSRIPMQLKSNCDWRMSLERLDNRKGYINDNCVLICWEFNSTDQTMRSTLPTTGSSQWSRTKFKQFYMARFAQQAPDY